MPTKRFTISTSRHLRKRPIAGWLVSFEPIISASIAVERHSRIDDWLGHLPAEGVRQMCAWERFCMFAREPERRLVDIDCRLTVAGVAYEVDAELAGETVVVWWGLFDQELWVERGRGTVRSLSPGRRPDPAAPIP